MGHGKETPRQKMIGMMYLVLTALLALNVSAEVLNAFVLVDESLRKSADILNRKSEGVYAKFDAAMNDPSQQAKTEKWKIESDSVKAKTNRIYEHIDSLKNLIVYTSEGPESEYLLSGGDVHELKSKGDLNVGGQIMVLQQEGLKLKQMIRSYDSTLVDIIVRTAPGGDTSKYKPIITGINSSLNTDSIRGTDGKKAWEIASFDHLPLAGVLTMLSKVQTDLRNAEGDILNYLYGQIDAESFKFNKLEAIVNANSNYVLVGNPYEADVFIAASDSTTEPEIILNGGRKLDIVDGKGKYKQVPSQPGFVKWGGVIKIESPATGQILEFPFSSEFQAAQSELIVSPTKMNVFYIGVDNPVDVSVAGVPADKVQAALSGGGSIVKTSGSSYVARVKRAGTVSVSATATFDDGTRKNMGSKEFRVKRVPDPVAMVANMKSGNIAKNVLLAQSGVKADLENFDFDLKFKVISFTVNATIKGYEESASANGPVFTAEQKALIGKVNRGRKVYIENIKAQGPDGSIRDLATISFKLD